MVRKSRLEDQWNVRGPTGRNMPLCFVCKGPVDAANLEHTSKDSIEIKVHCHGKEDSCKIVFPYKLRQDWESDPEAGWAIKRAMADYLAFETSHTEK